MILVLFFYEVLTKIIISSIVHVFNNTNDFYFIFLHSLSSGLHSVVLRNEYFSVICGVRNPFASFPLIIKLNVDFLKCKLMVQDNKFPVTFSFTFSMLRLNTSAIP